MKKLKKFEVWLPAAYWDAQIEETKDVTADEIYEANHPETDWNDE